MNDAATKGAAVRRALALVTELMDRTEPNASRTAEVVITTDASRTDLETLKEFIDFMISNEMGGAFGGPIVH